MKLHFAPASPYVRKVMITAIEGGLRDRIETAVTIVAPHAPEHAYAASNPLLKVPALVRDDGSTLYDSLVICEYLDTLAGGRLFPREGEPRWQALRRQALADGIMDAALLVRYETVARPEALRWPEWIAGQYAKVDHGLDAAESEVSTLPPGLDIGQVALACALGYLDFRFAARPWRDTRPQLAAWFAAISARPSLAQTMPAG